MSEEPEPRGGLIEGLWIMIVALIAIAVYVLLVGLPVERRDGRPERRDNEYRRYDRQPWEDYDRPRY